MLYVPDDYSLNLLFPLNLNYPLYLKDINLKLVFIKSC
jgi:hypothetical protein